MALAVYKTLTRDGYNTVKPSLFRYKIGLNTEEVPEVSRVLPMSTPGATGLYFYSDVRYARSTLRDGQCIGVFTIPDDATFVQWNRSRKIVRNDKAVLLYCLN